MKWLLRGGLYGWVLVGLLVGGGISWTVAANSDEGLLERPGGLPAVPSSERPASLPAGWGSPPEIVDFTLTPLYLLQVEEQRAPIPPYLELGGGEIRLGEDIERLARHLDGRQTLLNLLLGEEGSSMEPIGFQATPARSEAVIVQLGDVASLAARMDFLAGFMQYLVASLLSSDTGLPPLEDEITLVFTLEGEGGLSAGVAAQLQGADLLSLAFGPSSDSGAPVEGAAPLGIREITVRISNGTIRSEAELDPADFTIKRGQLEVQFQLGPNTITSTTVFAKGEGVQKEVLVITAQLGDLSLTGQATWTGNSREFKLEATLAGLISFSTLLTPEGLLEPTLGLELRF